MQHTVHDSDCTVCTTQCGPHYGVSPWSETLALTEWLVQVLDWRCSVFNGAAWKFKPVKLFTFRYYPIPLFFSGLPAFECQESVQPCLHYIMNWMHAIWNTVLTWADLDGLDKHGELSWDIVLKLKNLCGFHLFSTSRWTANCNDPPKRGSKEPFGARCTCHTISSPERSCCACSLNLTTTSWLPNHVYQLSIDRNNLKYLS